MLSQHTHAVEPYISYRELSLCSIPLVGIKVLDPDPMLLRTVSLIVKPDIPPCWSIAGRMLTRTPPNVRRHSVHADLTLHPCRPDKYSHVHSRRNYFCRTSRLRRARVQSRSRFPVRATGGRRADARWIGRGRIGLRLIPLSERHDRGRWTCGEQRPPLLGYGGRGHQTSMRQGCRHRIRD